MHDVPSLAPVAISEHVTHQRIDEIHDSYQQLLELLDRAESVRVPDVDDENASVQELVTKVAEILDATTSAIEAVFHAYENVPPPPNLEGPRVGDVAYFALMTLGEIRGGLDASGGMENAADLFQIYERCAKACRAVRKSVVAVDAAVCSHEGLARRLTDEAALENSLEVRRAYTKFRRVIVRSKPDCVDNPAEFVRFFRSVGTQIAILVGSTTFTTLRLYDRTQIKIVQGRVIDWLRSDLQDVEDGAHIVQDILGFSTMLLQVSRRPELCEHDERLLRKLRAELHKGAAEAPVAETLLDACRPLEGLDDELTQMLDDRERDRGRWQTCLDGLLVSRFSGGASW